MLYVSMFFFFKQKTAYEMRISDWSSDVCSSDLLQESRAEERNVAETGNVQLGQAGNLVARQAAEDDAIEQGGGAERQDVEADADHQQIGRASCRERV